MTIECMSKPKPRSGSRHKPRRTISLPPSLYGRLAAAAEKAGRPINWEARMRLDKSLAADESPPGGKP
jgi:hypothetical protein